MAGVLLATSILVTAASAVGEQPAAPPAVPDKQPSGDLERARQAYDAALVAAERGDLARSAQLFALADQLGPNAVTLTSALQAAVQADDPALGMELVERAANQPSSEQLRTAAEQARDRFERRAGKLRISCGKARTCRAKLDGRPVAVDVEHWVVVGPHEVVFAAGVRSERHRVDAAPGTTIAVRPRNLAVVPPSSPEPAPRPSASPTSKDATKRDAVSADTDGGISPAWFWVGLGITAAAGTATIISAVDTKNRHDEFEESGQRADDGEDSQLRTNILFFSTLGLGVATAAVGLFAVDWSSDDESVAGSIQPLVGGAALSLGGRF